MLAVHLEGSGTALQFHSHNWSRSVRLSAVHVIEWFAFSCCPLALAKPVTECLISVTRMFFHLHLTHHPHSNPVLFFFFRVSAQPPFPVPVIWYLSPATWANISFSFSGIVLYFCHHTLSTHSSSEQHWTIRQTTNCMHRNMIFYALPRPLTHRCLSGAWGSSTGWTTSGWLRPSLLHAFGLMVMPFSASLSCLSILRLWDTRVHTQRNVFWMLSCPTNRLL